MNKRKPSEQHCSGGSSGKGRRALPVCLGTLLLLISFAAFAFPYISNVYYEHYNEREADEYLQAVERTESTALQDALALAQAYNAALANGTEFPADYSDVLNLSGTGLMGYVEIPELELSLPICHGTDPDTLQTAVGHLSNTALPVGGKGTNCVLTGHSGLASQRLFSDLDTVEIGDIFRLDILGEEYIYRVEDISVILPYDLDALAAIPGKDCCTLVTCTPFGVNTHRLLVRGVRIEMKDDSHNDNGDSSVDHVIGNPNDNAADSAPQPSWQKQYIIMLIISFVAAFAIVAVILFIRRKLCKRQ